MRARLAFVAAIAACYSPSAQPGAPCGPGDACPAGQTCVAGICGGTAPLDDAPAGDDAPADSITIDAMPDGPSYIPWGTAAELTSLETPENSETDPSITTDKLTAVLVADVSSTDSEIYIATRSALSDTFAYSVLTAVNATGFEDKSPEISGDGTWLVFTSNRSGSYEVYESTFTTVWSMPTVRADLSSASQDSDVAISPDGLTAVVVHDGSPNRMYVYSRANTSTSFGTGVLHTELNVTSDIASPTITNGGEVIYFHATTVRQLYSAQLRGNGTYSTPQPVTELNVTNVRTAAPFVLEGDDYMIFEIDGDIFETTR